MGMSPWLAAMTRKLSIKPSANNQTPDRCRLNQQNTNSRTSELNSPADTHLAGIFIRVAGRKKDRNCGRNAKTTNQGARSAGNVHLRFCKCATSNPVSTPSKIAINRTNVYRVPGFGQSGAAAPKTNRANVRIAKATCTCCRLICCVNKKMFVSLVFMGHLSVRVFSENIQPNRLQRWLQNRFEILENSPCREYGSFGHQSISFLYNISKSSEGSIPISERRAWRQVWYCQMTDMRSPRSA
jgi:hypothetical protein